MEASFHGVTVRRKRKPPAARHGSSAPWGGRAETDPCAAAAVVAPIADRRCASCVPGRGPAIPADICSRAASTRPTPASPARAAARGRGARAAGWMEFCRGAKIRHDSRVDRLGRGVVSSGARYDDEVTGQRGRSTPHDRHDQARWPSGAGGVTGLVAGAVGTAAMDGLWYLRYRRGGGTQAPLEWEFSAETNSWGEVSAPGQVGHLVLRRLVGPDVPDRWARTTQNVVHWATGTGWAAPLGL